MLEKVRITKDAIVMDYQQLFVPKIGWVPGPNIRTYGMTKAVLCSTLDTSELLRL